MQYIVEFNLAIKRNEIQLTPKQCEGYRRRPSSTVKNPLITSQLAYMSPAPHSLIQSAKDCVVVWSLLKKVHKQRTQGLQIHVIPGATVLTVHVTTRMNLANS